ncbi:membrane protein [Natronocella acetinitrilica]|uniref:UPF0761 membrane protein J2T57_002107 n=1 Tax=Natronocella acetinitrilica TaxID=414046 RepID=A0AAE3G4L1_9GAMM|nr:virulence factor BrkB family protein [Natronocella acetinitrilica]MCP1674969.1 membrane protein [Natronocella acetinitrilica]
MQLDRGAILEQGRAGLRELMEFWVYLARRFVRDDCLNSAATLSYTTLLSLVPLMAVSFSVLTAFPVFADLHDRLQAFLFDNLVPATGEVVQDYIQQFASRAAGLTLAGIIGITVSAVLMMGAIDRALNRIWRVEQRRRPVQSFMVYWTVITVGPFLVAISLAATSYVVALTEFTDAVDTGAVGQYVLQATPVVALVLAFTFLYCAVPNRRVPIWHAVLGALFAALLFELAKRGFTLFVTNVPTYQAIYGALATLPIFLIWIYVSWVVVLLGAEFTQAVGGYRRGRTGSLSDPRLALVLAVRLLGDFWRAQQDGRALGRKDLLRLEPDAGDNAIQEALSILERARLVRRTADNRWMMARDPEHFTLLDLYRQHPFSLAELPDALRDRDPWNRALGERMHEAMQGVEGALACPLKDVFTRRDVADTSGPTPVSTETPVPRERRG